MARSKSADAKAEALREQGTLHPAPESVADPRFAGSDFFDARDLVQTRYEMLRRVRTEGHSVTAATAWYGVSRPTFYKLLAAFEREGLWGLLPRKRGPKGRHKLRPEVIARLQAAREADPSVDTAGLVTLVQEHFGIDVHPRTVERALKAAKKKTTMTEVALTDHDRSETSGSALVADYEQLRCAALGTGAPPARGLGLVIRGGLAAWMRAAATVSASRLSPSPSRSRPLTGAPEMVTLLTQMVMTTSGVRP